MERVSRNFKKLLKKRLKKNKKVLKKVSKKSKKVLTKIKKCDRINELSQDDGVT